MHRCIALFILIAYACTVQAVEIAAFPSDNIRSGNVSISISLNTISEAHAELILQLRPDEGKQAHFYARHIPTDGIDGIGRPTQIVVPAQAAYQARGDFFIDAAIEHHPNGLDTYVAGAIEARLPIKLPHGDGQTIKCTVSVTYMTCTDESCNRPVINRQLSIPLPSHPDGYQSTSPQLSTTQPEILQDQEATLIQGKLQQWLGEGKTVFLNFTGPSCAVCQQMKKTVFLDPQVTERMEKMEHLDLNTDRSVDLALWQQAAFGTQARPLYVIYQSDGTFEQWSQPFSVSEDKTMADFLHFLDGGEGMNAGTGTSILGFIILAIGGGLFTLVMPCTYPMIPLTINFFNKQAQNGYNSIPLALFYSLGIMASFTLFGMLIVYVLNSAVASFAGSPWTNLIIALLFLGLGLSLLDVFFLRLPYSVSRFVGTGLAGYAGALIMGCTFAITAFTCTAPFAGAVLAEGVQSQSLLRPIIGMLLYSGAIAIPFFIIALVPNALKKMPNAGSWMSEIKHIGGVIEIAAALKFLIICDFYWGWNILDRTLTLSLWLAACLLLGFYTLGYIRLAGDNTVKNTGVVRLIFAIAWFIIAGFLMAGLLGWQNLGIIESFFPADAVPIS